MMTTRMLLTLLGLPGLVALGLLSLLWVPKLTTQRMAGVIPALAITLGFLLGYWIVVGRPILPPPIDAKSQLPIIAGCAFIASLLVGGLSERPRLVRWAVSLALSIASSYLLVRAAIAFRWSSLESITRVSALAVGLTFVIESARSMARRLPPRVAAASLALFVGLGAPVMLFADSLLLAQLHGALGVVVGVLCVVTWIAPARISLQPVSCVVMALTSSLWIICFLFASLPTISLVLMIMALPVGIAIWELFPRSRPIRRQVASLAGVIVLVCASLAVSGARYTQTSEAPSETESNDYGYQYGK